MSGVSFASAGSGFDPLTPTISNVIPIAKQMENFRECKRRLESVFGKEETKNHIEKAAFMISAGTNDFVLNYLSLPELWEEGGRKIAVVGLPPMGCLPIVITFNSDKSFEERECIDKYSSIARDYNQMLQNELHFMQLHFNLSNPSSKIYYIDIYQPLADMIEDPQKYGFDVVDSGCCGSGYIEASFLCNHISSVCSDPSKYVFWDSIHPTQKAYQDVLLRSSFHH
ncbi:GDSL esterase/lipase [Senna tora]|uniref:GDSL esterase/lipase n=1 Tax=Senna tora TaxID=362788 RepID=A0A834SYU3_9FABA|nr:GDSL esterase/lipase [Senna tora]